MIDQAMQSEIDRLSANPHLKRVYRKQGEFLDEPSAAFWFRYEDDDGAIRDGVVVIEAGGET